MTTTNKKSEKESKWDKLVEMSSELPLYDDKDYCRLTEAIPSGSLSLDLAIGINGHPRGAIVDIFGSESTGKSLISIMAIAQVQKAGGVAVVWDAERSYSKNLAWMRVNGIDTSKLKFLRLRPTQGAEIGFAAIIKICQEQAADLIVVDSIPALMPQSVLEREVTEAEVLGRRAGMMSAVLPRLVSALDDSKACLMFINQMRANIGGGMYGPSEKETGGFSLKFFSSVRLRVKRVPKSEKMENDVPVGHRVHVSVVKNKVAAPYRQAEFDLYYNSGVDNASEVADILVGAGAVEKKGAWYFYEEQKFQGMAGLVEFVKQPKNMEKAIKKVHSLADKINTFGVQQAAEDPKSEDGISIKEDGE